jgi:3-deoxy-7-phosphoheptulonate synthase
LIIVMETNASAEAIERVSAEILKMGGQPHLSRGKFRTVIGAVGDEMTIDQNHLTSLDGVEKVVPIMKPYKLASREFHEEDSVVEVGGGNVPKVKIGGKHAVCISGPCTIENHDMLWTIARHVRDGGATILRGGAFKPRTSPYSFQGRGEEALKWHRECGDEMGMPVCSEVMDTRQVELVEKYTDMFQIGARNMQNFDLLKEIGQTKLPVLMKRGMSATVKDLLMSAEYILSEGNPNVVLCERGVRTFEESTRNMLDLSAVPNVKGLSHLPIIVDPSHATGRPDLIPSMACAAVACGADGVHIEVHSCPEKALSDGPQALLPPKYAELMVRLRELAKVVGSTF